MSSEDGGGLVPVPPSDVLVHGLGGIEEVIEVLLDVADACRRAAAMPAGAGEQSSTTRKFDSQSGDNADSVFDAAIAKHPGNPEDFQKHMWGFIEDFLAYMSAAAPETATQTFHVPLDMRSAP